MKIKRYDLMQDEYDISLSYRLGKIVITYFQETYNILAYLDMGRREVSISSDLDRNAFDFFRNQFNYDFKCEVNDMDVILYSFGREDF